MSALEARTGGVSEVDFAEAVRDAGRLLYRPVETRACPDQYVGQLSAIEQLRSDQDWQSVMRMPAHERPSIPALIVVLESPHFFEYVGEPGPAKGSTGLAMARWLREVVGGPDGAEDRAVLLVNAVQYQCSLGRDTSLHRDTVFRSVWTEFGEANFKSRIEGIFRKGDKVVCCCTKGYTKPHLRNLVLKAISEADLQGAVVLRRQHPSSWWRNASNRRPVDWPVN